MAIDVRCECGKVLHAREEFAGRSTRCPKCGAPVTIPVRSPGDGIVLELEERPETERLRCPLCQQIYPGTESACAKCAIDLRTGLPLAGPAGEAGGTPAGATPRRGAGRILRSEPEDPEPEEIGFATLLLWTVIRPLATMDRILVYLGRPDMLVKMGACYLASLVVVGVLGGFGFTPAGATRKADHGPAVGDTAMGVLGVGEVPTFERAVKGHSLGRLELDFRTLPAPPARDRSAEFRYTVRVTGSGEPYTKGFEGLIYRDTGHEDDEGHFGFEGQLEMTAPGEFVARVEIGPPGRYACDLTLIQAGDLPDIQFRHYVVVPERLADAAQAAARRAPFVLAGVIVLVAFSLAVLLFDAVTLNVCARMIGGGGGFLPMLIVLAYLSGIVNFAKVVVIGVNLGMGQDAARTADLLLGVWNYALYVLALMKVYDLELGWALGATVLAGIARLWIGMAVLAGLAAALGVVL